MTHTAIALAKANATVYTVETESDAYLRGFDRGYNVASWQDLPEVGSALYIDGEGKITVDADNLWDTMSQLAYAGESHDRDFSPFEFTAHEFNESEDADSLWEAFDAGISDGIGTNLSERKAAYVVTDVEGV